MRVFLDIFLTLNLKESHISLKSLSGGVSGFFSDNNNRVKLLSEPGIPGSDYINASFVSVRVRIVHTTLLISLFIFLCFFSCAVRIYSRTRRGSDMVLYVTVCVERHMFSSCPCHEENRRRKTAPQVWMVPIVACWHIKFHSVQNLNRFTILGSRFNFPIIF